MQSIRIRMILFKDKTLSDKRVCETKYLIASSVVVGNILYGAKTLKNLSPLPPRPTQILRRERIVKVAHRSFFGGIKFSGFICTYLLCDFERCITVFCTDL